MTKTETSAPCQEPLECSRVVANAGSILVAYRDVCPYFVSFDSESTFCMRVTSQDRGPLIWVRQPPVALELALRAVADEGSPYEGPIDLGAQSPFQRQVLEATQKIPRGEVRTYGALAASLGRPAAARAVGTALARNPLPLLIPCHRVVAAHLRLGRYSDGGPLRKRQLLVREGADVDRLR